MTSQRFAWAGLSLLVSLGTAQAQNWTQFRGQDGTNVITKGRPPVEWSAEKNVAWKVALPGVGWSSPVIWGDKVFVTTAVSEKQEKPKNFDDGVKDPRTMGRPGAIPDAPYRFQILCLDKATGKTLWERTAAERKPAIPIHPSNTYATETPTTDGKRLYAYFGGIGLLACYDLDGKPLWTKELGAYPTSADFGTGSSLALADGRLYVQCDNETKSFLLALDAKTGKQLWKADRDGKTSWSSPLVWKNRARTELVACGAGKVVSYDPKTGKELWRVGGIPQAFSASPAADAEAIFFGNSGPGSPAPLYAVKAGVSGDLTLNKDATYNAGVAWFRTRSGPGFASPLVYKGLLYIAANGFLFCHDAKTGEPLYKERLPKARNITSSLWAADDRIFCLDESGQTFVVQAGAKFALSGTNTLPDTFWATPSVAGDSLFLRGVNYLYCVRK